MSYIVKSEFIDRDEHHYIVGDVFPFSKDIEVSEARIAVLSGENKGHEFIQKKSSEPIAAEPETPEQGKDDAKKKAVKKVSAEKE